MPSAAAAAELDGDSSLSASISRSRDGSMSAAIGVLTCTLLKSGGELIAESDAVCFELDVGVSERRTSSAPVLRTSDELFACTGLLA